MCWAAMHRGAMLARSLGQTHLATRWQKAADYEQAIILKRAYNPKVGLFAQILEGKFPDAANLLLPSLGIIDAHDPRFIATLAAYERLLVDRNLMLRYRNTDDFGDTTSAFTLCSFWWAEALALTGRLHEAAELFQRLVAYANPLGLFSEDIDPTSGALLGNFPQAYTHAGLIKAAVTIGELLEAKKGQSMHLGLFRLLAV